MSSTIKYKGTTIATAENNTKTLQTSGKYLEGDIEVTDVSSGASIGTKIITANGQYDASDDGYDGYSEIDVNVPNTYSASDEGKVVSNGALVSQTSRTVTENGTYDTTLNDEVVVNVSGGASFENEIISGTLSGSYENSDVTAIRAQAFRKFNSVTSVSFPNVTSIGAEAFRENTGLQSVSFPKVASSGGTAFYGCTNLTSVNMPLLKNVVGYSFQSCSKLESFVVPISGGEFEDQCLASCAKLKSVDGAPRIIRVSFQNDPMLNVLVLRYSNVVNLTNISCFSNTPFASGKAGGTLYVPSALISSYQSATNWSTILGYANNSIQAIEGSQYENYYADGTPIS